MAASARPAAEPTPTAFDADRWASIYETRLGDPSALVFRHGQEVAMTACRKLARPGHSWVDVGCGPGHLAAALANIGIAVTGVDHDQNMIDRARAAFSHGGEPHLRYERSEASDLPFGDMSRDGVVATAVMGCLASPEAFLLEAARVLRPGGSVILTLTNETSALHALATGRTPARADPDECRIAARTYSGRTVRRLLEDLGLQSEQIRYYNFFLGVKGHMIPPRGAALALERVGSRYGSLIARNLLVVARRPPV